MALGLGDIVPVIKIFGVAGIFGGIMLLIISEVGAEVDAVTGTNATYTSAASNGTNYGITAGANLMNQLPLIGTIIGLAILLGIVMTSILSRQ